MGGHQTGIPKAILTLTVEQGAAHGQKIFFQFLIDLVFRRHLLHAAHQCGIDPSVASRPIAGFTIRLMIGRHIVGIAPPQSVFGIEESACQHVSAPTIHHHGMLLVTLIVGDGCHLEIERHGHLNSINPCPPAIERIVGFRIVGFHLQVEILSHLTDLLIASNLQIAHQVGLTATLVVGIARGHTIAGSPLMGRCPAVGIVGIARIGIYLVERHQSFIIYGTGP